MEASQILKEPKFRGAPEARLRLRGTVVLEDTDGDFPPEQKIPIVSSIGGYRSVGQEKSER